MVEDMSRKTIRAAGGVLWREAEDPRTAAAVEVAVIHRPRYDDWTLPKGKLAPGEAEIEGAIREVMEETGQHVHVGRALGEVRYTKMVRGEARPKVVRYWSLRAEGGTFIPSPEVDDIRWLNPDDARETLSYDRDREVLEKFLRGPASTRTVLLVRHASAGRRDEWEGDDRLRPLDERGRQHAEELTRLLARFEVGEIHSADFVRCVQTVEPLADALGLTIKEEPLLSEDGYPAREAEAAALIRRLGGTHSATVVCSQGDVIPSLLTRLADEDHVDLPDPLPYKKAATWVLSFDGDRLFSADYQPPPRIEAATP